MDLRHAHRGGDVVEVICVNGMGRSGTTALAAALASADETAFVGELRWLGRDLAEDRMCTCGRPARECPMWGKVWSMLLQRGWSVEEPLWEHGPSVLQVLAEQAGAEFLLESSKGLRMAARLDRWAPTRFVWVRRRWAGGGWLREQQGRVEQRGFGPAGAAVWFAARQLEVSASRYLLDGVTVNFEEILRQPAVTLEQLHARLGLPTGDDDVLRFPHVLTANRCRFLRGRRLGEVP